MSESPSEIRDYCPAEALLLAIEPAARAFFLTINGRQAITAQVRAILGITNRKRIDLVQVLKICFGVERPQNLFAGDASRFIDELEADS